MKRSALLVVLVFLFSICFKAQAQDKGKQEAAMKDWQAYMTPGDVHKMMAKDNGEWTYEMSSWMEPGAPPTKSTGSYTNQMILGGRYQQSKYSGSFMGQPFEGIATTGYDNAKKTFYSTWIDNMGTGIMMSEGKWDEASKTLTMTGTGYDPIKKKDCQTKSVMKWPDDNTQIMEMYMIEDGKEMKTMEITSKRK